jgi:hypothetical protein
VKAFIRDMLEKLETEAEADATKKAYRDKELAEANQKKDVYSAAMEKGPNGIKMALKVFNDHYAKADKAHDSSDGASTGIIGLLGCASLTSLRVSLR